MKTSRKLSRRSFVATVLGGVAVGGGATRLLISRANAQTMNYTGVTDCDSGANRDRAGYGTGVRNQYTDRDTGPGSDPRCGGRGPQRQEGGTSGSGRYGDAPSGCSDTDSGTGADPGGRGVRCGAQTPPVRREPEHTRHCTDSDRGNSADMVQQGRHC